MVVHKVPVIMRAGKTARDHESGAWARRLTNQETRKSWDRETTAKGPKGARHLPIEVCNGRKSRSQKSQRVSKRNQPSGIVKRGGKHFPRVLRF